MIAADVPPTAPPEPLAFPTDRRVLAELQAGAFDRIPDSNTPGNHESNTRIPDCRPGG
jgi:hypothetical protein